MTRSTASAADALHQYIPERFFLIQGFLVPRGSAARPAIHKFTEPVVNFFAQGVAPRRCYANHQKKQGRRDNYQADN
jgi:hypothetical protein